MEIPLFLLTSGATFIILKDRFGINVADIVKKDVKPLDPRHDHSKVKQLTPVRPKLTNEVLGRINGGANGWLANHKGIQEGYNNLRLHYQIHEPHESLNPFRQRGIGQIAPRSENILVN